MPASPPTTDAGDRWRALLDAAHAQSRRLADPDWVPAPDAGPMVSSFRADPFRAPDNVLVALMHDLGPDDTVIDVGAGAGRFALPIARRVGQVIAVEPDAGMRAALGADAAQAGLSNVRTVARRWPVDDLQADVVFAAHVLYGVHDVEHFLASMTRSARRWAAVLTFADPPQVRLFDFWQAVFGEQRVPNPSLPQLVEVLRSLHIDPSVSLLDTDLWPLGAWERARNALRSRLQIAPGSDADARLASAMPALLTDWERGYGPLDRSPLQVAVVRWPGDANQASGTLPHPG